MVVSKRWVRMLCRGSTGSVTVTVPKRLLSMLRLLNSDVEAVWSLSDDGSVGLVFRPRT